MSQNTIYVNYMTKTYHNFLKSQEAKQAQAEPVSFADKIAEKRLEASGAGQMEITSNEMTLEEYKQYIHDKISQIPISPSQMSSSFSIHISDAGFEAMKADPEYEKWVLDTLKHDFGFNNPWAGICGGSFVVHNFGATKEEYSGQSWYAGYQNGKGESLFNQKAEDSFWERRMQRRIQLQEQQEELQMKRMLDKRLYGEDYMQQTYFSAELLFMPSGDAEGKK
ncbi:hypothetical protein E5329_14295 [Petralouisia muris]|uniref:Uncharacterized protein n=1 Tax=Petralouisia muris TaxID=3032872 RepID=A0AC61RUW5_9FIRM|nr:hypothetical protein [Petralouisia muris]TGY95588.1 hypothetical protein E5329_14295 [Petralouisia muris]